MTGLNKYDDKKKREIRRKFHKEKDFRSGKATASRAGLYPKRNKDRIEDEDETIEP